MNYKQRLSAIYVKHIAKLAAIPISETEEIKFADEFNTVLAVIDNLKKLDVKNLKPASQVTGFSNIFRDDKIDSSRLLTQVEALKNAKRHYNGYFVVKAIFDE